MPYGSLCLTCMVSVQFEAMVLVHVCCTMIAATLQLRFLEFRKNTGTVSSRCDVGGIADVPILSSADKNKNKSTKYTRRSIYMFSYIKWYFTLKTPYS